MSISYHHSFDKGIVHSIFNSINGEVNPYTGQGSLCTFVRLRGCNLRCPFCDTEDTQKEAFDPFRVFMDSTDIESMSKWFEKNRFKIMRDVTITGGEPMFRGMKKRNLTDRPFMYWLVNMFSGKGRNVTVETNGTLPLFDNDFHPMVRYVADLKLFLLDKGIPLFEAFPSIRQLRKRDIIKIVLNEKTHLALAKSFLGHYLSFVDVDEMPRIAVSVAVNDLNYHVIEPNIVVDTLIEDFGERVPIIFNTQIHKFLKLP